MGRVFAHDECQGSCVLVSWLDECYMMTSRHVVVHEDEGGIPYSTSCQFGKRIISLKEKTLVYLGSSNSEIDMAFFLVKSPDFVEGFILETDGDIYHGQEIVMAGFPIALVDVEGKLVTSVKFHSGRVSSAGSFHDTAFTDISGCLPNTSGGAMISSIDSGRHILGIHMGVIWHEDLDNKVGYEIEGLRKIEVGEEYHLWVDQVLPSTPCNSPAPDGTPRKGNTSKVVELAPSNTADIQIVSPAGNTRLRGMYASDNIPFKGAMSYFVTDVTILKILKANQEIFGKIGKTDQSAAVERMKMSSKRIRK